MLNILSVNALNITHSGLYAKSKVTIQGTKMVTFVYNPHKKSDVSSPLITPLRLVLK